VKLCLYIDSFFEQDAFEQRVLVAQHQALVGSAPMGRLKVVQVGLVDSDGLFELLDILCAPLSERRLRLPIPLLTLLGSGVDWFTASLAFGWLALLWRGLRRIIFGAGLTRVVRILLVGVFLVDGHFVRHNEGWGDDCRWGGKRLSRQQRSPLAS